MATGIAVLALGSLAGCAPAVPNGTALTTTGGSSSPLPSAPGAGTTSGATTCAEFTTASFAKVVNVPVGAPFTAASEGPGSIACWYGIGKNASLTGSSIETLTDDNILITTIGIGASDQFTQGTASEVNLGKVIPLSGVGDKAAYNVSALTGGVPQLYELKGSEFCHVQMAVAPGEMVDSSPEAEATDESALCADAFTTS